VSDQRQTFSIEQTTPGKWVSPSPVLCRFVEIEPISGAGLYFRYSGPLAPLPQQLTTVATYDGTVPYEGRTVFDLGTEDTFRLELEDMSGSAWSARVRTDTEPILTSPIPRTFAGTQVTPLPNTPAFPVVITGATGTVDVSDRAGRALGFASSYGGSAFSGISLANAAATVNLPANVGLNWHIFSVSAGFSATPTQGWSIAVQQPAGTTIWQVNGVSGATPIPTTHPFGEGIQLGAGNAGAVVLSAGGAGIIGTLGVVAALRLV
jgi:hypothetical protein